jgi:hypothetical protein
MTRIGLAGQVCETAGAASDAAASAASDRIQVLRFRLVPPLMGAV